MLTRFNSAGLLLEPAHLDSEGERARRKASCPSLVTTVASSLPAITAASP
jgi:hypothetical protein